jgi:acyl carrier protein
MDKRSKVRAFLENLLERKGDAAGFTDSDRLITAGRLDSVDALDVVVFLEESYGVDFGDRQFDQDELDSVSRIVELIEA